MLCNRLIINTIKCIIFYLNNKIYHSSIHLPSDSKDDFSWISLLKIFSSLLLWKLEELMLFCIIEKCFELWDVSILNSYYQTDFIIIEKLVIPIL